MFCPVVPVLLGFSVQLMIKQYLEKRAVAPACSPEKSEYTNPHSLEVKGLKIPSMWRLTRACPLQEPTTRDLGRT